MISVNVIFSGNVIKQMEKKQVLVFTFLRHGNDDGGGVGGVYGRDGEGDSVPRGKNQWMCISENCTEGKQERS